MNRPSKGRAGSRWAVLVSLVAAATLLGGCAASTPLSPRAGDQAQKIRRLEERVLELQRRLSVTEVELERLRREVARAQGNPIAEPAATADRSGGPEPRRSDQAFEVEDIEDPPARRRSAEPPPSRPPRAVEEPVGGAEPGTRPPESEQAPPGPERASSELTDEAQSLYDRGYTLYHQGRYVDAESTFRQFLQAHASTELADNAQYWIGEARYARGDLEAALAAFRETASRFPEGNKVPDAMLKAGETQAALGDPAGARETYRQVVRRFPGTTAAAVAEDRLAGLR